MSASEIRLAPSRGTRLVIWFAIYLAGSFPFTIAIPLFPLGLAAEFSDSLVPGGIVLSVGAYSIYGIHLWLTLRAETLREFLVLIFCFVLLVFATFMACAKTDIFFGAYA